MTDPHLTMNSPQGHDNLPPPPPYCKHDWQPLAGSSCLSHSRTTLIQLTVTDVFRMIA